MKTPPLHTRLVDYYLSETSVDDVARKLNLDPEYVNSLFSSWRQSKSETKKEIAKQKAEANEPIFSLLPEYKIFEFQKGASDFCLETNDHEVLLAYHRMINPPKKKVA